MNDIVCEAIRNLVLLEFDYDDRHRVVAPYCHGFTANGEVLRAIQVGGESRSHGMGFGKLWLLDKIVNLRLTSEPFVPNDPHYNPNDSAMTRIHCRAQR
jgi:hypothetical protein